MILAADIGATHSRLALFAPGDPTPREVEVYSSADSTTVEQIAREFLSAHPAELDAVTFGVAGPVIEGRTTAVNLAWPVDATDLAAELGISRDKVSVINDMEANAWGLEALAPEDLSPLNPGEPQSEATAALISAGTGLGEGFVTHGPDGPVSHASEGGHVDFAPRNHVQSELRSWLAEREGHVSVERVCSGTGLVNIYEFLRERAAESEPDWLLRARAEEDEAVSISNAGLERRDPVASDALDLMVSIYGAQAGNLALTVLATGGVYLGGGIAPRIVERLHEGGFMDAFTSKGRMSGLMARIPVWVILNDRAALLGAARHATHRTTTTG